jgi:hypothetical protein
MANNTWKNYTQKDTTLLDNDEVMLLDSTDEKNKRGLMSKFWDYVVDKMSTAVISKLETKNKTVIGALNYLNGNHVTIVKEVKITTTEKLSYTGAEITIKENQIALLCFTNNWNDVKPDAMQISTSKTELSVSNIISPEITNYPIRYSIIFSPKIETTLYAWTRHTGENMNGIVKIEGIIFDL